MNPPPKEKRRTCYSAPLSNTKRLTDYRRTRSFQDLLARRLNRDASVAELIPRVLAITLAQGTRCRASVDHKRIARCTATAKP